MKKGFRGWLCCWLLAMLLTVGLAAGCDRFSSDSNDLTAAREAAAHQDWSQVARLLQRYLREENDVEKRWEAWNFLVEASQKMGEAAWASEYLESMLHEFEQDSAKLVVILRNLGTYYEKARMWDKASTAWLRLLDLSDLPRNDEALLYRRMGIFQYQNRDMQLAEDMFDMCVEHAVNPVLLGECQFFIADIYADSGEFEKSLNRIEEVLAVEGVSDAIRGQAYLLKGDIYHQQNATQEALKAFTEALRLHPNPAVVKSRIDYLSK